MLIVCAEQARVEAELVGGLLGCPSCRGVLGPWGHARERVLRCRSGDRLLRPRRARCRGCAGTHVLLPDVALLRRQDEVAVIGAAIEAKVAGEGYRPIACGWGCMRTRCVAGCGGSLSGLSRSGRISRGGRSRWIRSSGRCCRRGAAIADALEAIAVAARAWVLRFGPGDPWRIASRAVGRGAVGQHEFPLRGGAVS